MARKGSRLIMKHEEPGVIRSPCPTPISSAKDLLIPSFARLGALVLSTSWATTGPVIMVVTPTKVSITFLQLLPVVMFLTRFLDECLSTSSTDFSHLITSSYKTQMCPSIAEVTYILPGTR